MIRLLTGVLFAMVAIVYSGSAMGQSVWDEVFDSRMKKVEEKLDWSAAAIGRIDSRLESMDAHIKSLHDDVSGIYNLLDAQPKTPAPTSVAKQAELFTVLTGPMFCPACDRLKATLQSAGIPFRSVRDDSRSSWPGLLVGAREVDVTPYLSVDAMSTSSMKSAPATAVMSPVMRVQGWKIAGGCGNPTCHIAGAGTCSCNSGRGCGCSTPTRGGGGGRSSGSGGGWHPGKNIGRKLLGRG